MRDLANCLTYNCFLSVSGFDPDIPGYPRYSMIVDERRGVYNLRLRGVQLDDEGEYQCQVRFL